MDIRETLLKEHTKVTTLALTEWIGGDPDRFAQLIELFISDEYRVVQRSAWVVSHVGMRWPWLFEPHIERIIEALKNPLHPAVARNTLKVLAETNIVVPEEQEGILVDLCFKWLMDISTPVAIRAFSMEVLANACEKYPELSNELKAILEEHIEHGSAGFRSRGKRILKRLG